MAHVRQQIRERIGSVLTTAAVATTITQSRVHPLPPGSTAALIYTLTEAVTNSTLTYPRKQERSLTLIVELVTRAVSNLDDALDDLCVLAEQAIANDQTVNGLADDVFLASTAITHSFDGDAPIGSARLEFIVMYRTVENSVSTAV
jgi:hypothetical protein